MAARDTIRKRQGVMDSTTLIEAFRVDGKVAVVTGAGSGIGRATALALAGAGATVVCADIHADTAAETAEQIRAAGGRGRGGSSSTCRCKREVDDLADRVAADQGGIDVWCNIAGIMVEGPFLDDRRGGARPHPRGQPEGRLLRLPGGRAGDGRPGPRAAASSTPPPPRPTPRAPTSLRYAICKAGVVQMTKSLAVEIGKKHVRVNAVAPGFVLTGMTSRYFVRPDGTRRRGDAGGGGRADAQVHAAARDRASPRTSRPPSSTSRRTPPGS